jgi:hypothetical protein
MSLMMKKGIIFSLLLIFLVQFSLMAVSAKLQIEKNPVIDVVVPETQQNAVYKLTITNLGEADSFRIYSLVGVRMLPNETFQLEAGETKDITVNMWPGEAILSNPGTFNFAYKIMGEKSGIQEDVMLIRVVKLKDALDINAYNINPNSTQAVIYVKNKVSLPFDSINTRFHSSFFDFSENFSLDAYGAKEFEVNLDKEKTKELVAGLYIISSDIEAYGANETIENSFRFAEKEEITTKESRSGFLISKLTIEKTNEGNLPAIARVEVEKSIFSRLFATFNAEPSKVERKGFMVDYIFQQGIGPGESFVIRITTNWIYPLVLLIAIVLIVLLVRAYTFTFLLLRKRTTFVKTKGGEFALKVTLIAKSRKFVEKISVFDRIPVMMKVHRRFGTVEPTSIDEKTRRLEWNIDALQPGEERVFSYIIYSKIAPVGKFELPTATATFEQDGKIHEVSSNRVFFMTEPRKIVRVDFK